MTVIYVQEQGSVVRKRGGRILVEKDDTTLLEIPLRQTEAVAVFGSVQVTTQALSELLERGIPLALYTRHGRLKGRLVPETSKNLPLRLAQYRAAQDPVASLCLARAVVRAKLLNSAALVAAYRAHYPAGDLARAYEDLRAQAARAASASGHAELLGCEGAGAAVYFRAFAAMNRSDLPFSGREKHPPPDPVNALLSLGYTMAMNEIRALADGLGLEPHLGFLHRVDYGRPSLALDLLEPFRACVVDRLTLRLLNERMLTAEDFARRLGDGPGRVVLLPASLKKYLDVFERALEETRRAAPLGMRQVMRAEVEKLARALRQGTPFEPFLEDENAVRDLL